MKIRYPYNINTPSSEMITTKIQTVEMFFRRQLKKGNGGK